MRNKIIQIILFFYFFISYIGNIYYYISGNIKESIQLLFWNLALFDMFIYYLKKNGISFNEKKLKLIGRLSLIAVGIFGYMVYFTGSIFGHFMIVVSLFLL